MNELVTMTLVAAATLSSAPLQKPESSAPLPMAYVEACRLEFTQPASPAKFVGTVEYRATAGRDGVVTRLTFVRHVGNPPPEMRMGRFVQLEHFEARHLRKHQIEHD